VGTDDGATEGISVLVTDPPDVGIADGDKEGFHDGGDVGLILGFLDGANSGAGDGDAGLILGFLDDTGAGDDPDDAMKGTLEGLISIPEI
jgi:hypothetical protein